MRAITSYSAPEYRGGVLRVEVIDPRIADVEALARWLDYAFVLPGGFRYGLGGIIGLIPGLGDIVDALVSVHRGPRRAAWNSPRHDSADGGERGN